MKSFETNTLTEDNLNEVTGKLSFLFNMWKYFAYYLLTIKCCVYGNGDTNLILPNYDEEKPGKYNSITNCIIAISNQELFFRPTIAILEKTNERAKKNLFINELIDKLTESNIPQVIGKDILSNEYHDLHINSLMIAHFKKCSDISKFDFIRIDRDMRFLVIISEPSSNYCEEQLQAVGELVCECAVTFIIQDFQKDENKMFTIFPKIDGNTCEEVVEQPTHINTCFNGTIQSDDIFPIKNPGNLNKCPFRVGMATGFPFSTIKDVDTLKMYDDVKEIKGSDYEIIKIVAKHFNATLEMHYIYKKDEGPYSDMEFIKLILNGSLDACAGGIYRVYGDIVEYSGIYISQGIFWVYYAEREERSWENLMSKLDDVYIFIIFYITYSFVWCLISFFDGDAVSLIKTFLYCWGALIGASSLQEARSRKQKFMNLVYFIMCLYSSAYTSMQFYSFLTIRAPPLMLKTNSDFMDSGRIPYLINKTKYFTTDDKYVKFADNSGDCTSFYDCIMKTLQLNGLTILLQANFYEYQAVTAVNDEARLLKATENMLTVFNEMIISKNSSLVAKFQKVMQRLFEAGITKRLFTEAVGISVVAKAISANTNMISTSYSCQAGCSITLKQFAGVFYAWIFGCVISSLVFVIEIFVNRENRQINVN